VLHNKNRHINEFDQSLKNRFKHNGENPDQNAWNELEAKFSQIEDEEFDNTVKEIASKDVIPPKHLWGNINKVTNGKSARGIYWVAAIIFLGSIGMYLSDWKSDRQMTNESNDNQLKLRSYLLENKRGNNQTNSKQLIKEKSIITEDINYQVETVAEKNRRKKNISELQGSSGIVGNKNITGKKNNTLLNGTELKEEQQGPSKIENPEAIDKITNQINSTKSAKKDSFRSDKMISQEFKTDIINESNNVKRNIPELQGKSVQETSNNLSNGKDNSLLKTKPLKDQQQGSSSTEDLKAINQVAEQINSQTLTTIPTSSTQASNSSNKESTHYSNGIRSLSRELSLVDSLDKSRILNQDTALNKGYLRDNVNEKGINANQVDSALSFLKKDTQADSLKVTLTDTNLIGQSKEEQVVENDAAKKWIVAAYFLPTLNNYKVIKTDAFNYYFDSLNLSHFIWSFELELSYAFKNNFRFGLGFQMNKHNYQYEKTEFGYEEQFPIKSNSENGTIQIQGLFGDAETVNSIGIGTIAESETEECLCEKEINYKEKLQYTAINIPFDIKWTPGSKRIKPILKLGGELVLISKSASEVTLTVPEGSASVQNYAQLKRINFATSVGFGTQIDLTNNLGILLIPSITYQPFDILKNARFPSLPYSIRLYSGLYYTF
jgi:hypothetical protein